VDVNGLGYEVHIPLSTFDRLPETGEAVSLLTHFYVREDTHRLFGFSTLEEKDMFLLLLAVSGIGPSIALAALSGSSVDEFKAAIAEGEEDILTTIPGIGRKTAARIIVELKDKIGPESGLISLAGRKKGTVSAQDTAINDAIMALVSLGYKRTAARQALEKIIDYSSNEELDAEVLIRTALRKL